MEPQDRNTARETPRASRATVGKRRFAMRMIRDPLLGMVLVYQMEPSVEERGTPTLVMETGEWCVRLDDYPPNWRDLPDHELLKLRQRDARA